MTIDIKEERSKERKNILKIAIPVLAELLLASLLGMVDMIMVGRYGSSKLSSLNISSIGVTNQLVFLGLSMIQALTVGGTAMISRYIGQNRKDRIESVVKHVVLLVQIFMVLPILIIGLGFTDQAMIFFGGSPEINAAGSGYFRVIAVGFIFQSFNFAIFASLRGSGNTKTPMKVSIFANITNVFGNYLLIYGIGPFPELGILGAGISTSFSYFLSSMILFFYVLKTDHLIKLKISDGFKFDKDIIYNMLKIGFPSMLEQVALRVGILIFVRLVSSLGPVAFATHQIGISIINLSFTQSQGLGITASALVGRSLGEENYDLAERYIEECNKYSLILSIIIGGIFFLFGGEIVSLYTENKDVITEGESILKLIAFVQPFQSVQLTTSGGLRGAGDTMWTMISTLIGITFVRTIFGRYFVLSLGLGLFGAWLALLVDQAIRWIVIRFRYKTGKWKYVKLR